jgi:hypothetical protein
MKDRIRYDFRYGGMGGPVRPCHKKAVSARDDGGGYAGNLRRGFPLPEDDFGEALACGAVVIHACEAEVFNGVCELTGAALGFGRVEPAIANGIEQGA